MCILKSFNYIKLYLIIIILQVKTNNDMYYIILHIQYYIAFIVHRQLIHNKAHT